MKSIPLEGETRAVGERQGFALLHLRDRNLAVEIGGASLVAPVMESEWRPSEAELAALNAGAAVEVSVMGHKHPPIAIGVKGVKEPT